MKKGDVVTVIEGSLSRSIIDRKLIYELKCWRDEQFVIIEVDCKFPTTGKYQSMYEPTFNNTVIQAIDSGKVVFIQERFLKLVPPKHTIVIDAERCGSSILGKVIEISDELYQKIKYESK